jgi:hypothetical protein
MRSVAVLASAGCRCLLVTMLAVCAVPVAGRAQSGNPPPAPAQTTPPPQPSQPPQTTPTSVELFVVDVRTALEKCHNLALLAIQKKQIDADLQKKNADLDCKEGDQSCLNQDLLTFQNTMRDLQKQSNIEDANYNKQLAELNIFFGNYATCSINTQVCPADIQAILAKPLAQMSCSDLSQLIPGDTTQ